MGNTVAIQYSNKKDLEQAAILSEQVEMGTLTELTIHIEFHNWLNWRFRDWEDQRWKQNSHEE